MRFPVLFALALGSGSFGGLVNAENLVARDGVGPPTPAFSELSFSVLPTTSRVAVGLLSTGKYVQDGWIVGDCRG